MGSLLDRANGVHEITTEMLGETEWWSVVDTIVKILESLHVKSVRLEYGFVLERQEAGLPQGMERSVPTYQLKQVLEEGIHEGTIERSGQSDFIIRSEAAGLAIMLCNDTDIHFGSKDSALLGEVAKALLNSGKKIHGTSDLHLLGSKIISCDTANSETEIVMDLNLSGSDFRVSFEKVTRANLTVTELTGHPFAITRTGNSCQLTSAANSPQEITCSYFTLAPAN